MRARSPNASFDCCMSSCVEVLKQDSRPHVPSRAGRAIFARCRSRTVTAGHASVMAYLSLRLSDRLRFLSAAVGPFVLSAGANVSDNGISGEEHALCEFGQRQRG